MNAYTLMINPMTNQIEDISGNICFMVHGADNLKKAKDLFQRGVPATEVPHHFCGYCGEHVPIQQTYCTCGHLKRQ